MLSKYLHQISSLLESQYCISMTALFSLRRTVLYTLLEESRIF